MLLTLLSREDGSETKHEKRKKRVYNTKPKTQAGWPTSGNYMCKYMLFNFKRHNITYQILKRNKYFVIHHMTFIYHKFHELCLLIFKKHVTLVARRREHFRDFLADFFLAELPQKRGCFNTQEFTRFLSTGVISESSPALWRILSNRVFGHCWVDIQHVHTSQWDSLFF